MGELAAKLGLEARARAFRLTREQTAERVAVFSQPGEAGGGTAAVCGVHARVSTLRGRMAIPGESDRFLLESWAYGVSRRTSVSSRVPVVTTESSRASVDTA